MFPLESILLDGDLRSLVLVPIRLFAALIVLDKPVVPLAQVSAPTSTVLPLSQLGVATK